MSGMMTGAKSVFTSRGMGEALATALVVFAVLVILHRYKSGKYAPANV